METLRKYRDKYLNLRLYDGALNTNVRADSGMTPGMVVFHSKNLIRLAKPNLVHDAPAKKENIPQNGGSTIQFRKFEPFAKALGGLEEGVSPAGHKVTQIAVTASIDQFGDFVAISDRLANEHFDKVITEVNAANADQAGRTSDTITREIAAGGSNKTIVPSVASDGTETEILLRKDIVGTCALRIKDINRAVTMLKRVNTPKIDGAYIGIIHPDISGDIRNSTLWQDWQKYTTSDKLFAGEIGMIHGVRFLESSEAKIIAPAIISDGLNRLTVAAAALAEATTVYVDEELTVGTPSTAIPVYINGVANTITKIETDATYGVKLTIGTALAANVAKGAMLCGQGAGKLGHAVYCTLICGRDAYAVTSIEGEGLEFIYKSKEQAGGPLDQRATCGWKLSKAAVRLIEAYLVRIECTSPEFGLLSQSN